jgi:putative transposase
MFGAYVRNMPRRDIQFKSGNYYHVFNRGFCRRHIFKDKDNDARFFVEKSIYLSRELGVHIESRAMMTNHFHFILIQNTDNNGIQKMMYRLQMSFAKFYNNKYRRRGQVFEGRFKAKYIHDNNYYWGVTNYVFRNPVK